MPINWLAMRVYPEVCDQLRPAHMVIAVGPGGAISAPSTFPVLDMPAVCAVVERLGELPRDWSLLLRQLRLIHRVVGECQRSDGQPG